MILSLIAFMLSAGLYLKNAPKAQTPVIAPVNAPQSISPPTIDELFALINAERAKVGVAPLAINPLLNKSAQMKADEMVIDGYGHVNSSGKHGYSFIDDVGARCSYGSENNNAAITSVEAVEEWMGSPSHRQAILDPRWSETGFGIAKYADYYYVVQHFCQSVL